MQKNPKLLSTKVYSDSRGKFCRTYDIDSPETPGFVVAQSNVSVNPTKGTLRGMHFQVSGPPEDKLVTLLSGSVFIVTIDLRYESSTFLKKTEMQLKASLEQSLFIPSGFATGWISTSENTSLQYLMSARYEECSYSGIRFDDCKLGITWPAAPTVISDQDLNWPNFTG